MDHLTRNYGRRRGITDFTFQVEEGEIFGFLGYTVLLSSFSKERAKAGSGSETS